MIAAAHVVVFWFEEGRIIVRTVGFVTTRHCTVKPASVFPMMAYQAVEIRHTRAIRSVQSQEWCRNEGIILRCIPNRKAFPL